MVAATVVLVVAGLVLITLQFVALRRGFVEDAEMSTRVTGINAAAAVVFGDYHAATETLATLRELPHIESAAIYGVDRKLFASYVREDASATRSLPPLSGLAVDDSSLLQVRIVEAIRVDSREVGTLVVRASLERLYWRLLSFALMFVLAALIALAATYPLVARMRHQVATAAGRIREQASLLDKAQDAIIVMSPAHKITYWNKSAERLYQWPASEAVGRRASALLDGDQAAFESAAAVALERGEWGGELKHHRKDGSSVTVESHLTLVRDNRGKPKSILAIETDITMRKRAEARVSRLSRLRAVHGGISSAVLRVRERDELLFAACRVAVVDGVFALAWAGVFDAGTGHGEVAASFGDRSDYVSALRFTALAGTTDSGNPVSRAAHEARLVVCNDVSSDPALGAWRSALLASGHRSLAAFPLVVDGHAVAVLVLCASEPDFFDEEEIALLEWLGADLSYALDHLEKTRRLDYLAYYDALTGLPNNTLFRDRLAQFLHATRDDSGVCLMLVDIVRFTTINDSMGRDGGDTILRAVAARLGGLSEPFTVARISADTFAIASVCARGLCATQLRDQVLAAMRAPFRVRDSDVHVDLECGLALYPEDGDNGETLFKNAEAALREAKSSSQQVLYYSPEMNASMAGRRTLEAELRVAVAQEQFVLHYQPRVDLLTGRIVGVEALIRWQHPGGELMLPSSFIELAEQTGLIAPIGEWVLNAACRQQAAWIAQGIDVVPVGVNMSAVQFRRADVLEGVRNALLAHRLDGKHLEVELTESTAMENPEEAARTLHALRELNVRISLDDFGTGFSSLAYLKRFPLNAVKIDRTFVRDVTSSPDDAAIATAVIALAHGMGIRVVAEGVESEAQLRFLRSKNCDEMQGFAFSGALSASGFAALLASGKRLVLSERDAVPVGTLLIVDDEPGIRSALQRTFRREGYRILTASGGAEGLELLAMNPVSVIISDQRMPGMSGAEFLDVVRKLYPATVRIILSGYTDLSTITDAVNRGAIYKFLLKPWDDDQIREQVRHAFRIAAPTGSAQQATLPASDAGDAVAQEPIAPPGRSETIPGVHQ